MIRCPLREFLVAVLNVKLRNANQPCSVIVFKLFIYQLKIQKNPKTQFKSYSGCF